MRATLVQIIQQDVPGECYQACTTRKEWEAQLRIGEAGGALPQLADHRMFCFPYEYGAEVLR